MESPDPRFEFLPASLEAVVACLSVFKLGVVEKTTITIKPIEDNWVVNRYVLEQQKDAIDKLKHSSSLERVFLGCEEVREEMLQA